MAKIHQIQFPSIVLCTWTRWGVYYAPPDPLGGWGGDHLPELSPLSIRHLDLSAVEPQLFLHNLSTDHMGTLTSAEEFIMYWPNVFTLPTIIYWINTKN